MVEKYFQDYKTMDIKDLIDYISMLHEKSMPFFNKSNARMKKITEENYENILKSEILPDEGLSIEEVFEHLGWLMQGVIKWNHPGAMININPPSSVPSVAAASYFSLYTLNGAQDMSSGLLLSTELAVVKMICQLVGWDESISAGIFTFGGKSTNLHAVKHGIQRVAPNARESGVNEDIVVFSSEQGHPCHSEVCGWLGIGENNCIRIPTDKYGKINLVKLEEEMEKAIQSGKKIATIIANGCTTIQMTIDPIDKIVDLRDKLVAKYSLNYSPRVHVDSVIGWVWLFFKDYNFDVNELMLSKSAKNKISKLYNQIKYIRLADSFGVDFHKTGFCSYLASLYITKDREELYNQNKCNHIPYEELEYGNYSPFQYTLELSRSLGGPISAYTNLKILGIRGYQELIGRLMDSSEYLKDCLNKKVLFEVINQYDSDGFVTLFVAKENENDPSFFELANYDMNIMESYGMYNYKFYLYLLEQQQLGDCWYVLDYSSGYHVLPNGKKIGVLKIYPMSPFFTRDIVNELVEDLFEKRKAFDKIKDEFIVKEVPHKPRPFVFK